MTNMLACVYSFGFKTVYTHKSVAHANRRHNVKVSLFAFRGEFCCSVNVTRSPHSLKYSEAQQLSSLLASLSVLSLHVSWHN